LITIASLLLALTIYVALLTLKLKKITLILTIMQQTRQVTAQREFHFAQNVATQADNATNVPWHKIIL
jgi:hypothetical protein